MNCAEKLLVCYSVLLNKFFLNISSLSLTLQIMQNLNEFEELSLNND